MRAIGAAARPGATITELAFMPDELADGAYSWSCRLPALAGMRCEPSVAVRLRAPAS